MSNIQDKPNISKTLQNLDYHKIFEDNQLKVHNKIANFIKWVVQATGNKLEKIGSYIRHLGKKYQGPRLAERSTSVRVNSAKDMHDNNYLMLGSNKNFRAYRNSLDLMDKKHPYADVIVLCADGDSIYTRSTSDYIQTLPQETRSRYINANMLHKNSDGNYEYTKFNHKTDVYEMVNSMFSKIISERYKHFEHTNCKEIKLIVETPPFITTGEITPADCADAYITACEAWMLHMQTEYNKKITILSFSSHETQPDNITNNNESYDKANTAIATKYKKDRLSELKKYIDDYKINKKKFQNEDALYNKFPKYKIKLLIKAINQAIQKKEIKFLKKIRSVNQKDNDGYSLLILASRNGHEKIVELLIAAGADVNQSNNWGYSALMLASLNGHEKIVKLLIAAGVDVNQKHNDRYSPLRIASRNGHEKIVELLIAAGADVHKLNRRGYSALMLASINGHEKIVKLLIAAGADVNQSNNGGDSALRIAGRNGHEKIVELLIAAGADVTQKNEFGTDPVCSVLENTNYLLRENTNYFPSDNREKTKTILGSIKSAILILKVIPQQKLNDTIYLKILDAIAKNLDTLIYIIKYKKEENIKLVLPMHIFLQHMHLKLLEYKDKTQENLLPTITRVNNLISSLHDILVSELGLDEGLQQHFAEYYLNGTPLPLSVLAQISVSGALGINKNQKISELPIPKIMQTALLQECLGYL